MLGTDIGGTEVEWIRPVYVTLFYQKKCCPGMMCLQKIANIFQSLFLSNEEAARKALTHVLLCYILTFAAK